MGMRNSVFLPILLFFGFFISCAPPSENFLKKGGLLEGATLHHSGNMSKSFESTPRLDPASRGIMASYGSTIRMYSDKYGFDWRLVLAVMRQESRFEPLAESPRGAAGFMQIMPTTGEELGKALDLEDLTHPMNNIQAGIYYLSKIYSLFDGVEESDRLRLTLAAYNAGIGRIYDAQELAAYMQDNPTKWQSVRDALPLLSKRFYTLHKNVWLQEKPKSGWFGSSRETIAYVSRVMEYYEEYRLQVN